MRDFEWLGVTAVAILLIIYVEVKRARRRTKKEQAREALRRHISGHEDE